MFSYFWIYIYYTNGAGLLIFSRGTGLEHWLEMGYSILFMNGEFFSYTELHNLFAWRKYTLFRNIFTNIFLVICDLSVWNLKNVRNKKSNKVKKSRIFFLKIEIYIESSKKSTFYNSFEIFTYAFIYVAKCWGFRSATMKVFKKWSCWDLHRE